MFSLRISLKYLILNFHLTVMFMLNYLTGIFFRLQMHAVLLVAIVAA